MDSRNCVVGFVGLGAMGSRIVKRLIDAGFKVVVFDRTREKAEAVAAQGAVLAPIPRTLAMESDVIMSCLANDEAVKAIYGGVHGVIESAAPGSLVVEMSTISPEVSRWLWQAGKDRGIEVLDVAISGGPPVAEQGALTLLAGGSQEAFRDCEAIFSAIAKQYFHLGSSGSGTSMKLVVNTILGVSMQGVAEAIALGEKLGIERGRMLEVLSRTAVIAPAQQNKLSRAARNDYTAQFAISLMNKDFHLIMEHAAALRVPMPTAAAAFQMNLARLAEYPDDDYSGVIAQMEDLAGCDGPNPAGNESGRV
jgi:3-hydroxyisobutyrate dehydrogenase-like beta-hydroxyacid dehydrogenase